MERNEPHEKRKPRRTAQRLDICKILLVPQSRELCHVIWWELEVVILTGIAYCNKSLDNFFCFMENSLPCSDTFRGTCKETMKQATLQDPHWKCSYRCGRWWKSRGAGSRCTRYIGCSPGRRKLDSGSSLPCDKPGSEDSLSSIGSGVLSSRS